MDTVIIVAVSKFHYHTRKFWCIVKIHSETPKAISTTPTHLFPFPPSLFSAAVLVELATYIRNYRWGKSYDKLITNLWRKFWYQILVKRSCIRYHWQLGYWHAPLSAFDILQITLLPGSWVPSAEVLNSTPKYKAIKNQSNSKRGGK